jgi:hypothetical protein
VLKGLANLPGTALALHLALQVTSCHIQTHRVAKNVVQCRVSCNLETAGLQSHYQFNLVLHIIAECGIREFTPITHKIVWVFLKKERCLAIRVVAHLYCMRRVVASDAVDPMNWEKISRIEYRQAYLL